MRSAWLAAVLLLAPGAGPACAADWVTVKSTDASQVRVDRASIKPAGEGRVSVWSVTDYSAVQTDLEDVGPYQSLRIRLIIDCTVGTAAMVRHIYFAGHHGEGAEVFEATFPPEFDTPPAGKTRDRVLDVVCESDAGLAARSAPVSASASTYRGDWVTIASREELSIRLDRDSIQPAGDGHMEAWTLFDFAMPRKIEEKTAASARSRMLVDCVDRTAALTRVIAFAERHGEGAVVHDESRAPVFDEARSATDEALSARAQADVVAQVCPAPEQSTAKP